MTVLALGALALGTTACGPATPTGPAKGSATSSTATSSTSATSTPSLTSTTPAQQPTTPTATPTKQQTKQPTKKPTAKPTKTVKPSEPRPEPVVVILRPGDFGPKVRAMQARLKQIGWFSGDVSNNYGSRTTQAVQGFQGKRGFPVTGVTDERTYNRILSMTRTPTRDELNNVKPAAPKPSAANWDVDKRCLTGRVICISKSTRSLTWVIDGKAQYSMAVRFGSEAEPTREGVFGITWKKVDVISNLYYTPMPYSMFFSGGQAIHYSGDFARNGYNGSSHGCVNVRNMTLLKQLYNAAPVGTKVVVHW
ncbi:MAG TPA: L,D-transpeptidase family protein [Intrasporangium sp.]|nr:L,D-transpeptidase family protein [Intrasporangium sp.]